MCTPLSLHFDTFEKPLMSLWPVFIAVLRFRSILFLSPSNLCLLCNPLESRPALFFATVAPLLAPQRSACFFLIVWSGWVWFSAAQIKLDWLIVWRFKVWSTSLLPFCVAFACSPCVWVLQPRPSIQNNARKTIWELQIGWRCERECERLFIFQRGPVVKWPFAWWQPG